MDFTCILFGILFSIYGILFSTGKIHVHLTAWKTMPEEEKRKINILPLCMNIGEVITGCGIIFLVRGLWQGFTMHWFTVCILLWLVIAFADILFISKSKRYYRE